MKIIPLEFKFAIFIYVTFYLSLFVLASCDLAHAELTLDQKSQNNLDNFISVEFDNAPLTEIVILVSEVTGQSFVISTPEQISLSWVEQNIAKDYLMERFKQVITGAGLSLNTVHDTRDLFIIKNVGSVIGNIPESLAFYYLKNLDPQSLKDTSEVLYAGSLAVNTLENSNIVLFSGFSELVKQFIKLLDKIDRPQETDVLSIRVKNVSVKAALKAITDTKLIEDNSFYPEKLFLL